MEELRDLILKVKEDNPDFGEPWQADAFVMALTLSQQGYFSWTQWVDKFGHIIKEHPQVSGETSENAYYRQWLACMEEMMSEQGVLSKAEILICEEKWRVAYRRTPHGQPVELHLADDHDLSNCSNSALHDHDDEHHHHHGHISLSDIKPLKVFKSGLTTAS